MFCSVQEKNPSVIQMVKPDVSKKFYELSVQQDLYATVDLIHGTGSLTRIETRTGSYTIKRQGFFMPYISVRKERSDEDLFSIPLDQSGRAQFVFEGQMFRFVPLNLWKNQWGWINEKNKQIIKYFPTLSGQVRGDIEIGKDFFYFDNIELIAAIGSYLLMQLEDELSTRYMQKK